MSNKFLSFLVLFWVIAGFVLFYMYFFVYYTATITNHSNVWGYSVKMFGKSIAKTFMYDCPDKVCIIKDISPLEYNMTIKRDGYIDFFQNITLWRSVREKFIITLEKKVLLERVEDKKTKEIWKDEKKITTKQRIIELRKQRLYKKLYTKVLKLWESEEIGIKEKETQIEISYIKKGKKIFIGSFDKKNSPIKIENIRDTSYIFIENSWEKYIYGKRSHILWKLLLTPKIHYIKPWKTKEELIFITDKGAFIYNIGTNTFTYFYFFRDFVYLDDGYIGVIFSDEKQKRNNYNLEEESENIIMRYIPKTQERKILYKTNLDIEKIFFEWKEIFFEVETEKYKLENY